MMEHSCAPTCSFNTVKDRIVVVALKVRAGRRASGAKERRAAQRTPQDLAAGEALSIDYVDGLGVPTALRQEKLLASYGVPPCLNRPAARRLRERCTDPGCRL
jgi:hypothetical protein